LDLNRIEREGLFGVKVGGKDDTDPTQIYLQSCRGSGVPTYRPALSLCRRDGKSTPAIWLDRQCRICRRFPWPRERDFKQENVDVSYSPGGPNAPDPLVSLASNSADYGFVSFLPLLDAIAKGNEFVIVGAQFQQSPLGILSLAKNPIQGHRGQENPRPEPHRKDAIDATLALAGVPQDWTMITTGFSPEPLVAGDGDGYTAFGANQTITPEKMGLKAGKDFFFVSFDEFRCVAMTTSSSAPAPISKRTCLRSSAS
jgi:NMT1/THI5 like